jgi:hypothetical protein
MCFYGFQNSMAPLQAKEIKKKNCMAPFVRGGL